MGAHVINIHVSMLTYVDHLLIEAVRVDVSHAPDVTGIT